MSIYMLLYLLLCAFVGHLGRHRAAGFLGVFLAAVFFTPLITFIVLMLSRPAPRPQ